MSLILFFCGVVLESFYICFSPSRRALRILMKIIVNSLFHSQTYLLVSANIVSGECKLNVNMHNQKCIGFHYNYLQYYQNLNYLLTHIPDIYLSDDLPITWTMINSNRKTQIYITFVNNTIYFNVHGKSLEVLLSNIVHWNKVPEVGS